MILYHGSNVEVSRPDLAFSRENVDFGKGFYVTAIKDQAIHWSERFHEAGDKGVVSCYELNDEALSNMKVKEFDSYSEEWLDFVMACRRGMDSTDYDVVIGGVANDKVFNTVELYFENLIDKTEAIKRLRFEHPNHQMCFRTQKAMDECLQFVGSERL